jgi:predicted Zn-dependent protease
MILDLASDVLESVRDGAGAGAEAEVSVVRQSLALTRFANSFIHQNVADDTTTVRLRLHTAGRTVTGSTTVTSGDGLRDLVERTTAAVAHAPLDPGWPGLAPPAPQCGRPDRDESTAAASPNQRAAQVRAFMDSAGGLEAAGFCRTRVWCVGYANSAGQAVTGQTSEAAMDGIARHAGADGMARSASVRLSDLDGALLGARAAAKAQAGADPVELPPGRYEVVLEPPAVADVLQHLAFWGFNGRAMAEGRSFVRPGVAQFDESVTLVDDPLAAGTPGQSFDAEGTPGRRLVLVEGGRSVAVAHDRRSAATLGGEASSTGHAVPDGARWGAFPAYLGLLPGAQPGGSGAACGSEAVGVVDPAAAELVGGVERGLLVSDLWYTRPLDPKTVVVTGLTRNGVWLIEDGKITAPVANLRFTQSYPQALAPGAVKGIGPMASVLAAELISVVPSWVSVPALHVASWNFTGGADG